MEFNEDRKGKLKAGMLADVAILSHDLTTLAPEKITDAKAVVTICDGQVTYSAS